MTTFPAALAALTARCGEPVCMGTVAMWSRAGSPVHITLMDDDTEGLFVHVADDRTGDEDMWRLDGDGAHPLDEAADAAAGWLARATAGAEERR